MWCILAYLTIRYLTSGFRADWQFTIAFYNPDMRTPYRFNGAEFTFSLAFFAAVPDA